MIFFLSFKHVLTVFLATPVWKQYILCLNIEAEQHLRMTSVMGVNIKWKTMSWLWEINTPSIFGKWKMMSKLKDNVCIKMKGEELIY